ncbi:GNAT family N-acetyltransferase [Haloparvum sedimenti]|uniref:GNAT family N-acetyltransferase n=1 Tax=Haloparvum sedimenti TaxID=1678448 RepID=UPI00071E7FCF|nr:GNAT family N-acetyltransferase [Haloparvum sedimenti]
MEIRRLPVTDDALGRFAEELWLPYHRDLAAAVEAHALADRPDEELIAENVAFHRDLLAEEDRRGWVAVDEGWTETDTGDGELPANADLTGFVLTSVDACPDVFDRPDRLVVGDIYVAEPHRGSGLARRLVERAAADAHEAGCSELRLDVDVDNECALAFYEKLGFSAYRKQLTMPANDV